MRIAGIQRDSITNGVGVRDVVFFQGCGKHCKGCHNPQTWDYNGGEHRFVGEVVKELSNSTNNITISGGEPFDQYTSLVELCQQFKKQGKTIWVYTGNIVDPNSKTYRTLADYVEVIVDSQKYPYTYRDNWLYFDIGAGENGALAGVIRFSKDLTLAYSSGDNFIVDKVVETDENTILIFPTLKAKNK